MIRTQIQLPDQIHDAAKQIAQSHEMSLAEVVRRALEDYIARYPGAQTGERKWVLPKGRDLGMPDDIDWSRVKDDLYARDPFKSVEDQ